MATVDEKRAQFQRYKEDVKERGKPFYPYAMFHDTVMSLVVVSVIAGLACIWYFTSGEKPEDVGWLGGRYSDEADPGTTSFIPRPDWYFYFLFYLLRIFKWPESVILGTVGIPTLLIILMLALPFIDMRRERRLLRRPVALVAAALTALSMGVLTYKGATAKESLGSEALAKIPEWVQKNNLPEDATPGAEIFAQVGCLTCHTYLGEGVSNVGAPDLSAIGAQSGKDADYFAKYVANPRAYGNNIMPVYGDLGEENLRNLGVFLASSKGEK
jgi:quinol---cytochrome c reductase cytochrome c subunit, bacillus type